MVDKTLLLVAMSEKAQMAMDVVQAVTANVADADIEEFSSSDDGSLSVTLTVDMPKDQATCKAPDTGGDEGNESDTSGVEQARTKATAAFNDAGTTQGDDDEDEDQKAESEGSNPTNGEVLCTECQGTFDTKSGFYGHMSSCDAGSDDFEAADGSTDEDSTTDNDTNDMSNESDTNDENGWPSTQYLKNNGVESKNISKVQEKADEGCSQCEENGCYYAANGDEASFCASHQNDQQKGKKSGKSGDNSSSSKGKTDSTADRVKKVMNHFDVKNSVAQQAVNAVKDGFAESELAYLESQE